MSKNPVLNILSKVLGNGAFALAVCAITLAASVSKVDAATTQDNIYNTHTPHIRIQAEATSVNSGTYPDRFQAVQVFSGDVEVTDGEYVAANLGWGRSIDPQKLIDNMLDDETELPALNEAWSVPDGVSGDRDTVYKEAHTFSELFAAYLKNNVSGLGSVSAGSGNHADATQDKVTAPVIGKFLNAFGYGQAADTAFAADSPFDATQSAVAKTFAKIAANSLKEPLSEGNLSQASDASKWTSFGLVRNKIVDEGATGINDALVKKDGTWVGSVDGDGWVIDSISNYGSYQTSQAGATSQGVPKGYYLVLDNFNAEGMHEVLSEYLLNLVDNEGVIVSVKSSKPEMTKWASIDGVDNITADSVATNDEITFVLKGTLPENIASYVKYKMEFKDTLGSSFTIDTVATDVQVYYGPKGTDGLEAIQKLSGVREPQVSVTNAGEGKESNLTVTIEDLKTQLNDEISPENAVFVVYKVVVNNTGLESSESGLGRLNSSASTRPHAQYKNTAHMDYSNDPNWDGQGNSPTGKTPDVSTQFYTYGLDINKLKDNIDTGAVLIDAGFSILKSEGEAGKVENKELKPGSEIALFEQIGYGDWYIFKKWHTLTADDFKEGSLKKSIEGLSAIVEQRQRGGLSFDSMPTYWSVRGLDEGSYTLVESKTPEGYSTMAPFSFNFSATETLSESSLTVTGNDNYNKNLAKFVETVHTDNGVPKLNVLNEPAVVLPFTGGRGYLLYGAGLALVVGGVIYIVVRRKSSDVA